VVLYTIHSNTKIMLQASYIIKDLLFVGQTNW
jgi:hypothetical protein